MRKFLESISKIFDWAALGITFIAVAIFTIASMYYAFRGVTIGVWHMLTDPKDRIVLIVVVMALAWLGIRRRDM